VAHNGFPANLKNVRGIISGSRQRRVFKRGVLLGDFHQALARKVVTPESPRTFIPSRRKVYQIGSLPLREDEALQTANLPPLHTDPFDRMLICQSIVRGMAILTPDPLISQYPARVIW